MHGIISRKALICIILRPFLQKETKEGQALGYTICFYRFFREVTLIRPPSLTNNQHLLTKMSIKEQSKAAQPRYSNYPCSNE